MFRLRKPFDSGRQTLVFGMVHEQGVEEIEIAADGRPAPWQRPVAREDDPIEGLIPLKHLLDGLYEIAHVVRDDHAVLRLGNIEHDLVRGGPQIGSFGDRHSVVTACSELLRDVRRVHLVDQ
jgi:hypothetical protein